MKHGVVCRCAKAYLQLGLKQSVLVPQMPQRFEQRDWIAFAGIDDAAMQQGKSTRVQRQPVLPRALGSHKTFFVVPVLKNDDSVGSLRVTGTVYLRCTGCGENAEGRRVYGVPLDCFELLPGHCVGGIAVLGHRVAKVRHPRDTALAVQLGTDQVSGGDGVGGPDDLGAMFLKQLHALPHGVEFPADPTIGARHEGRIAAKHRQVASCVESQSPTHFGPCRNILLQIVCGALIGHRMR